MSKLSILTLIFLVCFAVSLGSNIQFYTIRLTQNDDLKLSLLQFVHDNNLQAVSIVTCVGSLQDVNFRLANAFAGGSSDFFTRSNEKYEIVSLVGTLEMNQLTNTSYAHLHVSVADKYGSVFGGHLMPGNLIHTTAEITLMENIDLRFERLPDPISGYNELSVQKRPQHSLLSSFLSARRKLNGLLLKLKLSILRTWTEVSGVVMNRRVA
jgi:predicted DNA-binding protein with PD1-like motif